MRTSGASLHAVRIVNGSPKRARARLKKAVGRTIHSTVCSAVGAVGPGGNSYMNGSLRLASPGLTVTRLLLVLAVLGLAACGASDPSAALAPTATAPSCTPTGGDQRVDGVLLHVPPHARAPLPLVLAFHGAGGNGDDFAGYTGLSGT